MNIKVSLFFIALAFMLCCSAQAADVTIRIATNGNGETIEVKPLDDPANPYLGQYEAWDLWVWENYHPGFNKEDYEYQRLDDGYVINGPDGNPMPEGWTSESITVDEQGYLVPALARFTGSRKDRSGKSVRETLASWGSAMRRNATYKLYGTGIQPDDLQELRAAAWEKAAAAEYPPIPAWLGENLPLRVVFSPNGDIICYGELGLHYEELSKNIRMSPYLLYPETWYRYSPEGELLGTGNLTGADMGRHHSGSWTYVYSPERSQLIDDAVKELREEYGHSRISMHYGGCFTAVRIMPEDYNVYSASAPDRADVEIARVWDIFGNEIDPDEPLEGIGSHIGMEYRRESLQKVYDNQIELGLTDPAVESPFAGLDNGPRTVDPTPRFPRLAATNFRENNDIIEVRPLDDPANPYLGEYREWDQWLLSQLGQNNPREMEFYQERHEAISKLMAEKKAAGEPLTVEDQIPGFYEPADDDPWEQYMIYVDDNGWIIPTHHHQVLQAELNNQPRDIREKGRAPEAARYVLVSGGIMPEDLLTGYQDACKVPSINGVRIPGWLANAPVHYALLVPNGDVVTLGPLGFRTEENAATPLEELWEETPRALYRYSADGELLGTHQTKGWDWQVLYYPHWNALKSNPADNGLAVREQAGYLLISDPASDDLKAVFDYDGMPVNPNAPVLRRYNYCRMLRWSEVEQLIQSVAPLQEGVRLSDVAIEKQSVVKDAE